MYARATWLFCRFSTLPEPARAWVLRACVQTRCSKMHYDVHVPQHGKSPRPKPALWLARWSRSVLPLTFCDLPTAARGMVSFYFIVGVDQWHELWELCWQSPCSSSSSDNGTQTDKQIDSQDLVHKQHHLFATGVSDVPPPSHCCRQTQPDHVWGNESFPNSEFWVRTCKIQFVR